MNDHRKPPKSAQGDDLPLTRMTPISPVLPGDPTESATMPESPQEQETRTGTPNPDPDDDSSSVDLFNPMKSTGPGTGGAGKSRMSGPTTQPASTISARSLLAELVRTCIINPADWRNLPPGVEEELFGLGTVSELLAALVGRRVLTAFQGERLRVGSPADLLLGNYRVLERLGAGGGGVVYKGQHIRFSRPVALKVLAENFDSEPQALPRFFAEMEAVGQLQHPHIVAALDAGVVLGTTPNAPDVHYLVMEYVPGQDLAEYVAVNGPLPPALACELIHQIAGALAEAHRNHLVHRDVKPSNIRLTPDKVAKLLDFGLVRQFGSQLTKPGIPMGTIDYMAPEQVRDSSTVDARTDVYGLGATLFWCLTGRPPFPTGGPLTEKILRRLTQEAPSVLDVRPEVPAELAGVVSRMLAMAPEDRYPSMDAVSRALRPSVLMSQARSPAPASRAGASPGSAGATQQILIVDDDPIVARLNQRALRTDGWECDLAGSGEEAIERLRSRPCDLVLLDIELPGISGAEVARRLREEPPCSNLKVIICSGTAEADEMARMLVAGADDYLTKPASPVQLQARVRAALQLKQAQDRSDALNRQLMTMNADLESALSARDCDLIHARNAMVVALAKLIECRTMVTGARLRRMQRYVYMLAEDAAATPTFAGQIDENFTKLLESCVPLHDIGKVGLPDGILLKPGKLDDEERVIMQTHTVIGAETLLEVAKRYSFARAFLLMAADIARHHHERYDGTGYPDRLAGDAIPLSARMVAVADVYDALRSRRAHRPALSHATAVEWMTGNLRSQFDPALLQLFQRGGDRFEQIYRESDN